MLLNIPIAEESEAEDDYDKELEAEERAKVSIMLLNVQGQMDHGSITQCSLLTAQNSWGRLSTNILYTHASTFNMVILTVNFSQIHGSMNVGFVTVTIMMLPNDVIKNKLVNSSHTHVNKPFVAIKGEDVAWELNHCSDYYNMSWSDRN